MVESTAYASDDDYFFESELDCRFEAEHCVGIVLFGRIFNYLARGVFGASAGIKIADYEIGRKSVRFGYIA